MSSTCSNATTSLTLLAQYGSLQLTAYKNAENGLQTAVEAISQTFVVSNTGADNVAVSWANITSTLLGTSALMSPPGMPLASGQSVSFPFNSTAINLYAANGNSFHTSFHVSGAAAVGGGGQPFQCFDTVQHTFVVRRRG
jgi:hypothetical protein